MAKSTTKAAGDETLGQRIARLRVAGGMTQPEFAEKAGVPLFSLRSWEQDHRRPRAEAAVRVARALGVTVEALVSVNTDRAARAEVQEPVTVRGLKRLWGRATKQERAAFLAWVAGDTASENQDSASQRKGRQKAEAPRRRLT